MTRCTAFVTLTRWVDVLQQDRGNSSGLSRREGFLARRMVALKFYAGMLRLMFARKMRRWKAALECFGIPGTMYHDV